MHHLIKLTLNVWIVFILSCLESSYAQEINLKKLSQEIENSLNSNDFSKLNNLIDKEIALDIERKLLLFRKEFSNAKWTVNPTKELKNKRKSIELLITAKKKLGNQDYSLKANQTLAIDIKNGKIINSEVISESSILSATKKPIEITLQVPDVALTGSWYDIDIIINKPLENSIIAGGLMHLKDQKQVIFLQGGMQLKPMGSGGIFKTVKAPLDPGNQRWAAIIAHPEGLISITKLVKVVSNQNDFSF